MLRDIPTPFEDPVFAEILMISDTTTTDTLADDARPVDPLDDVFGSAPSSPILTASNEDGDALATRERPRIRPAGANDPSDIPRLRSTHVTNGYREGIAASKEKFLQQGFDEGYVVGMEMGLRAGWCLGVLEGVLHALPSPLPPPPPPSSQRDGEISNPLFSDATQVEVTSDSSDSQQVAEMLRQATIELDMANLFGPEFFNADGRCTFAMADNTEDAPDVLKASEIATAHPLIKKWTDAVVQLAQRFGLDFPSSDT